MESNDYFFDVTAGEQYVKIFGEYRIYVNKDLAFWLSSYFQRMETVTREAGDDDESARWGKARETVASGRYQPAAKEIFRALMTRAGFDSTWYTQCSDWNDGED